MLKGQRSGCSKKKRHYTMGHAYLDKKTKNTGGNKKTFSKTFIKLYLSMRQNGLSSHLPSLGSNPLDVFMTYI